MNTEQNSVEKLLISVNIEKCIGCGECVEVCPPELLELDERKKPFAKFPEICIECGHCEAVCPKDALIQNHMNYDSFIPFNKNEINITFDDFNLLARSRRSIRRFSDKIVQDKLLDKLLESVKYAPTAENAQALEYIIIKDPKILQKIKEKMSSIFKIGRILSKIPILNLLIAKSDRIALNRIMERWNEGKSDPFLRNSPVFIIVYTKKENILRYWDSGIATYHLILAAETLGLGTLWNGFYASLAKYFKKLRKIAGIPKGYKVVGAIGIGYPKYRYRKLVPRKPLNIKRK